jgi:hypothetical protein
VDTGASLGSGVGVSCAERNAHSKSSALADANGNLLIEVLRATTDSLL